MEKLLVSLHIVAINMVYDILIPSFITIEQLIGLIRDSLADLKENEYISSNEEILCCNNPDRILYMKSTVIESGIKNGDRLFLF